MDKILWEDSDALIFISLTMGAIIQRSLLEKQASLLEKYKESTWKKVTYNSTNTTSTSNRERKEPI